MKIDANTVIKILDLQGRKIEWLSKKLKELNIMGRTKLWRKMKYNDFTKEELDIIVTILNYNGDSE